MATRNDEAPAILGGRPAVKCRLPTWPIVTDEVIQAAIDALKEGTLSETADEGYNLELEGIFRQYHGSRYAMAVNSGTAALDAAVFAVGVGPGDEVITSPLCPGYVVTPILHFNGIPVFADVDPHTGCIDPSEIEKHITNASKAILVVHLQGHPANMEPIMEIAARHDLKIIEDCAHSQGSLYRGARVGTLGHISAFSLQSVKNLPCGEGGIVLTDDRSLYERATLVGHHPVRLQECLTMEHHRRYLDTGLGWNYRMHRVAAAIAVEQMAHFDEMMALRRNNADYINHALETLPGVGGTYVAADCVHTYYAQMLTYDAEQLDGLPLAAFVQALQAEGVTGTGFLNAPVHTFGLFQDRQFYGKGCPWKCPHAAIERSYDKLAFPNAEHLRESAFLIGSPGGYVTQDLQVISEIADAFRKVTANATKIRQASQT